MAGAKRGKLFTHGGSQAVRLPKEFRLPGNEVRVSREGRHVILEPIARDAESVQSIFAKIDRLLEGIDLPGTEAGEDTPASPDSVRTSG